MFVSPIFYQPFLMRYLNIYKRFDGHTANACLQLLKQQFPLSAWHSASPCSGLAKNCLSQSGLEEHDSPAQHPDLSPTSPSSLTNALWAEWERTPASRLQTFCGKLSQKSGGSTWMPMVLEWVVMSRCPHLSTSEFFFFFKWGGGGLQEVLRGRMETLSCNLRQN